MPAGKSAREFAIDLKKFGEVTQKQAQVIFRKIGLELDSSVVYGTPVDTGRARGNWYCTIGEPSTKVDQEGFDPSGATAVGRIANICATVQLGQVIWLSNNLPYILPLENGHSKQAPQGMVDLNLERVAAHYGGSVVR